MKRQHFRCRKCHKRVASVRQPKCCPRCGQPELRIDKWANGRGWRKWTCYQHCQYGWPHHRGSEKCDYNRDGSFKTHEQLYGHASDSCDDFISHYQPHPADEYF